MEQRENADGFPLVEKTFEANTLVPIERVPRQYQSVFSHYMYFNRIQSEVFQSVFETDESILVSAPTGCGKTVIFELAIVKFLNDLEGDTSHSNFKIVYVAPMKAICEERLLDWHKKFSPLGLQCITATGDSDNITFSSLLNHNLIITTPEKWDSLTRNWRTHMNFVRKVVLFMIDEVHLLNDESRGPTLEAIVSRMKTIQVEIQNQIRFVAVSATVPNVEDVSEWIKTKSKSAKCFSFSDETRPVKLTKIVLGYHFNPSSTYFKFDIMLNYKLQSILMQYSNRRPTLIFCSTRKSVEMTSKHLVQNLSIRLNDAQKQVLERAANKLVEKTVKETLIYGVAVHHAGLLPESRHSIQELFRNGDLPVLVTTSTLAMGVNLPAHLVIIKSTKQYIKGEYRDYSESSLLQMMGRAGRPQYDSTATAVILTSSVDKAKFERMIGGTQPVESGLHNSLTEHLNAEIVLRTITDIGVAMEWLTSTFLYIRAKKNPRHYGFAFGLSPTQIDAKLLEVCQISINKLAKHGMISMLYNVSISPTKNGCLMAKYYLHFETMKLFQEVSGSETLQQILALISRCHEFSDMCLRGNDKKTLNLLNKCKNRETIRFPLSGKIKNLDMKINCLIQAIFGCLEIVETSLLSEVQKIMKIGERVSNCLAEFLESNQKCFSALHSALILAKCFSAKLWENSPYVSRQLTGIGPVMSTNLVAAGKTTFQAILDTNPRHLETIMHRKYPQGDNIYSQVEHLPQYELCLEEIKVSERKSRVRIRIFLKNSGKVKNKLTMYHESVMNLLIGDEDNNIFLNEKYTHSCLIQHTEIVKELLENFESETVLNAHFFSENWVGIDSNAKLYLFCSPPTPEVTNKKSKATSIVKSQSVKEALKEKVGNSNAKRFIDQYYQVIKNPTSKTPKKVIKPAVLTNNKEADNVETATVVKRIETYKSKSDEDECKLLMEEDDNFDSFDLDVLEEKLLESSNNGTEEIIEVEEREFEEPQKLNVISNILIQKPAENPTKLAKCVLEDSFSETSTKLETSGYCSIPSNVDINPSNLHEFKSDVQHSIDESLFNPNAIASNLNTLRSQFLSKGFLPKFDVKATPRANDLSLNSVSNHSKFVLQKNDNNQIPTKQDSRYDTFGGFEEHPKMSGRFNESALDMQLKKYDFPRKNISMKMNSVQTGERSGRKADRRFQEIRKTLDFENSLYNDSSNVNIKEAFALKPKKRLIHESDFCSTEPDSTESSYNVVEVLNPKKSKANVSAWSDVKKNIKWSSPLVTSKYSPNFKSPIFNLTERIIDDRPVMNRLKVPTNVVDFPVSDRQCDYASSASGTQTRMFDKFSDLLSHSFMESLERNSGASKCCYQKDLASYVETSERSKRKREPEDYEDSMHTEELSKVDDDDIEFSFQQMYDENETSVLDRSEEFLDKSLEVQFNEADFNATIGKEMKTNMIKREDVFESVPNKQCNYTESHMNETQYPIPRYIRNPSYGQVNLYGNVPMMYGRTHNMREETIVRPSMLGDGYIQGGMMEGPPLQPPPPQFPYYFQNPMDYYNMMHPQYAYPGNQPYVNPNIPGCSDWYNSPRPRYFDPNNDRQNM
ncbi:PREDICTED: probable ATP-dependent DNA helicase HFM1 [Nicrophorus vespilloides]|uniref:DNA 3'-5' helicase n=1 Tax=Nicrophorus vespilloides TaxID=110193 RepID=A0ABM1N9E4_NICVS|nr:PREDICTED: probable ATP-dependent DNA helicase HFM1 [Nicrophorus vespilloides]